MSGLHAGLKSLNRFNCSLCGSSSKQKERNGCKGYKKTKESVFILETSDTFYRFYQCPISLLTQSTIEWFSQYKMYKRFNNAPSYQKMSKKFIERCNLYESSLNELQGE